MSWASWEIQSLLHHDLALTQAFSLPIYRICSSLCHIKSLGRLSCLSQPTFCAHTCHPRIAWPQMLKHWVLAWRNSTVDLPPSRNWRDCSWAPAWAQLCHQATCPSSQTWSWWCGCRTGDAILQSKNVRQGFIQRREDSQAKHLLSTVIGGVWKSSSKPNAPIQEAIVLTWTA